jgi:hypothetical protein
MRKLLTLFVMLAVLGVCAPSYGYLLIYNVSSTFKGVDSDANSAENVPIKGFLVLDMNDPNETLDDAEMVLYGKDADKAKVYFVETFGGDAGIDWTVEGDFVTVDLEDSSDPFDYEMRLTGKIADKNVGLGADDKKGVANSLKGTIVSWQGMIFDDSQVLFGSGITSMTFYPGPTKSYNEDDATIDEVVADIQSFLEHKNYNEIIF